MATCMIKNSVVADACLAKDSDPDFCQLAADRGLSCAEIRHLKSDNGIVQSESGLCFLDKHGQIACPSDHFLVLPGERLKELLGKNHLCMTPNEFATFFEQVDSKCVSKIHQKDDADVISDADYRNGAIRAALYMEHNVINASSPAKATNVAGDRGGLTKYGITEVQYPKLDIANLTYEEAFQIYIRDYWSAAKGNDIPRPLNALTYDLCVTSGPKNAIRVLQRAVGANDDGIWGPQTKAAAIEACSTTPKMLAAARLFTEKRIAFYQAIVKNDSSQSKFLNGWINRAVRSQCFALALLHTLDIL